MSSLSAADAKFFLNILLSLKCPLSVDWEKVARNSGYNNGKTASTRFGQMKKKARAEEASTSASPQSTIPSAFSTSSWSPMNQLDDTPHFLTETVTRAPTKRKEPSFRVTKQSSISPKKRNTRQPTGHLTSAMDLEDFEELGNNWNGNGEYGYFMNETI
ncbi:hypothetical protein B0J14DRAFT_597402 [Halenospora varia]|nr:hypothetical protein B0J14DRAFT_597402 [Halenospora varia]